MVRSTDPVELYLSSLSPRSRRVYAADLRALLEAAGGTPLHSLAPGDVATLRRAVAGRWAPGTANRMIAAWRGVVRAAWRAGAVSWDVHLRTLAELRRVPGGRVTRGVSLTWGQVEKLLAAARSPEERALLATLAGCGLRRSEAAALTWSQYTRHDRDHFLKLVGKGNKERRLRVPNWAASALNSWRTRCPEREPIFKWCEGTIHGIVARAGQAAGLGKLAPHDLRRTYYSLCRGAGLDTRDVQRAMGHASISTTALYDRRSDAEALAALSKLDTPGG